MSDLMINPAPAGAGPLVLDTSAETFKADVIDASLERLVLVDFWAEWCGPCKSLGPLLEKVVASYKGRVRLAKVDIDKNQMLASQMRVQSVPTVFAFVGGRPVDGFAGALPESQLRAFIDQHLKGFAAPADAFAEALEQAQALLDAGDSAAAAELFGALIEADTEHAGAHAGRIRALLAAGLTEEALAALAAVPAALAADAQITQARAAAELAQNATDDSALAPLRAAVDAAPDDLGARFELARALAGAGGREEAADLLLGIIAVKRDWNDNAARQQLLKMLEAAGFEDPFAIATRRRLSAILFA